MFTQLKMEVCRANLALVEAGLVIETFGNVSGVDRKRECLVIKPSGVPYAGMKAAHMVVVSLKTGQRVEGRYQPSSDTPTHVELYRAFPELGGVVHTHSPKATAWAQACREIPPLGTTHADSFHGAIPCTRVLTRGEIAEEYEANTGRVIVERFRDLGILDRPGVLVANHGPFAWGESVSAAVHNAVAMEFIARLALDTIRIDPGVKAMPAVLLEKHFRRKHGAGAYYGQR